MERFELPPEILARYPYLARGAAQPSNAASLNGALSAGSPGLESTIIGKGNSVLGQVAALGQNRGSSADKPSAGLAAVTAASSGASVPATPPGPPLVAQLAGSGAKVAQQARQAIQASTAVAAVSSGVAVPAKPPGPLLAAQPAGSGATLAEQARQPIQALTAITAASSGASVPARRPGPPLAAQLAGSAAKLAQQARQAIQALTAVAAVSSGVAVPAKPPGPPLAAQPAGSGATLAEQARQAIQALEEQQRQLGQGKKATQEAAKMGVLWTAAAAARGPSPAEAAAATVEQVDDDTPEGDDENEAGHTYSEYKALQVREIYPDIIGHPDPLVETASLASIPLPPPTFQPDSLRQCVVDKLLSDAQLETVIYANMKFNGPRLPDGNRAGFFLGDGAGVGKGRQIAALIKQHWHEGGHYVLWVSVSNDLRQDAQRDLRDIEAGHIQTYPRGNENLPPARKELPFQGVLFVTYSMLVSGLKGGKGNVKKAKNVDGKEKDLERMDVPEDSRLSQFIRWLKQCSLGSLIIFDECHKAKNLLPTGGGKPSQTARAVVELQEQLPLAKVLYSSATGASEPRNLAYMTRLGMWGFKDAKEMIGMLSKSKLAALELAAMSMKATGSYISRTLSYEGAEFALAYVDVDPVFKIMYDRATQFWHLLWKVVDALQLRNKTNSLYWSAHQRFFKQMLMAAKVPACASLAKQALADGMCVVVGLQSTGEANTNALLGQEEVLNDLVSAPRMILDQYIRHHFPLNKSKESVADLVDLECQVWDAIQSWKSMMSAEKVVASGKHGIAADRENDALRMGMAVNTLERLPEEERVRRRLAMRAAEKKAEEEAMAKQRKKRQDDWYKKYRREERKLQKRKEEGAKLVQTIESELAGIMQEISDAAATNKPAEVSLEDSSEDDTPLVARASAKRHVLDDSDSEDIPSAKRPKQSQQIMSDSDDDATTPQPKACHVIHVDLTVDDEEDIVCELCGSGDDEETLLMCHHCESGAHLACLRLRKLPKGPWFCKRCKGRPVRGVTTAAATAAPQSREQSAEGSDEDDTTSLSKLSQLQVPSRFRLPKLQVERKLALAKQSLREVEQELEELQEMLEEGPPPTPAKHTRRPLSARNGGLGCSSYDPTVFNLEIKDSRVDGYRYAVKGKTLDDLERDADVDLTDMPVMSVGKAKSRKSKKSEESDEDYVMEIPDYVETDDLFDDPEAEQPSKELVRIRGWLQRLVTAMELPANPLDQLTELLGGEPHVAELTGRKGSVSMDGENIASYKLRATDCPQKDINLKEKDAFMSGRKLVAIISDAASTGVSLQADRRLKNQRRRCHITLELPWSADKAIQQFGRSHRANQVCAPLYRILVTPCGGEYRFAAAAAKRLQSLGALLKGDRNAIGAGSELKSFDIDNINGERALARVLSDICAESQAMPGVKLPSIPEHLITPEMMAYAALKDFCNAAEVAPFYRYMRTMLAGVGLLETNSSTQFTCVLPPRGKAKVPKFLNRLLGLNMECQELLFQYYQDTMDATIAQLKSEGKYEQGIVTIKGQSCSLVGRKVIHKDQTSGGEIEHTTLAVDRGVTWEAAISFRDDVMEKLEEIEPNRRHFSGFYCQAGFEVTAKGKRRPYVLLATEVIKSAADIRNTRLHIQRPNVGPQGYSGLAELQKKGYQRLEEAKAKELWEFWYNYTEDHCYHGDHCATLRRCGSCTVGMRKQEMHLLCGALLPMFKRLEDLHRDSRFGYWAARGDAPSKKLPLRIVKCITSDGQPVVGMEMAGQDEASYMEINLQLNPEADAEAGASARRSSNGLSGSSMDSLGGYSGIGALRFHPYANKKKGPGGLPRQFR